jgi:hypothetical protein
VTKKPKIPLSEITDKEVLKKQRDREASLRYYHSHRDEILKKEREYFYPRYRKREQQKEKTILGRYRLGKNTANQKGLEWTLTLEDFSKLATQSCYYCLCAITNTTGCGLDRIDNNRGYHLDNVLPCCRKCNVVRSNILTVEEMKIAMTAVLEYRQLRRQTND